MDSRKRCNLQLHCTSSFSSNIRHKVNMSCFFSASQNIKYIVSYISSYPFIWNLHNSYRKKKTSHQWAASPTPFDLLWILQGAAAATAPNASTQTRDTCKPRLHSRADQTFPITPFHATKTPDRFGFCCGRRRDRVTCGFCCGCDGGLRVTKDDQEISILPSTIWRLFPFFLQSSWGWWSRNLGWNCFSAYLAWQK